MKNLTRLLFILLLSFSCSQKEESDSIATMYFGGDIITMEGDNPTYAEALVEKEGKILFVGSMEESMEIAGKGHQMKNLGGKTLVPGFIDGHAHFGGFGAQAISANLLASPDGNINSIPELIAELKSWYAENGTDKTQGWIVGMGFDDAVLAENRFPTKEDLDQVSTEVPICIIHISGHFGVMNSKGLEINNITSESKDPAGGLIRRIPGSQEPNGVLEELAAIPLFFPIIGPSDPELAFYYLDKSQEMAAKFGYTTAQEGRAMSNHELMASYADQGKFYLDVVSYIDYAAPQYMNSKWNSKSYENHYRIGGLKLTLDGSPQGRTAWRTEPYLIPPAGQDKEYKGYPAIPEDSEVQRIVDMAFENNWQLLAHGNGDAAMDQLIRALRPAISKYGNQDRRNVLIHGQYIRMDQLDSLADMEVIASLFPMHTFYWGDWHRQIIGKEKADRISPIRSALDRGMKVTSHTDAPVALPNLMMILWTTVNRVSRSGEIIGAEERLTPYEALQSITIWSAYQHFEEEKKGSLVAGKLADLVILDKNPLKVDPMTLKDIQVMETIKEGKTIFMK
ncbi:amidohydrolase [Algoriphagus sp.]|uniref:amidohydrolase n=1 Tax=Algoriphagus sp. TaxID=1872435 RepID=UPI0025E17C3F|nr:amidohydrolase [Algoriphagus sp.]